MGKQKYYVVWKGRQTGIFTSWAECSEQVVGFPGAEYKSFETFAAAQQAFDKTYQDYKGKPSTHQQWLFAPIKPILPSIAVDAACPGTPGPVEYRGVETETGRELFHQGPFADGTNNIGEFLAIIHALAWLEKQGQDLPVYSDSEVAIEWVNTGKCRTTLPQTEQNAPLFALIARAEQKLKNLKAAKNYRLLKWDTQAWGENPADFGRK